MPCACRRRTASLLVAVLVLGAAGGVRAGEPFAVDDLERLPRRVLRRYWAIQSGAGDLRWRQIPWLTDLVEAVRVARQERRPLFLWVSGDEPLDRC